MFVEAVRLPFNGLSGTLPPELSLLSDIQVLELNNNDVSGTVPTELSNLLSLQVARFEFNRLTDNIDLCGIPDLGANCDDVFCQCCTSCCFRETLECGDNEVGIYTSIFARHVSQSVTITGTANHRAMIWIMVEDPMMLRPDDPRLLQRYMMVFLYFHTTSNGSSEWRSCNPPKEGQDDFCTFQEFTPVSSANNQGEFSLNRELGSRDLQSFNTVRNVLDVSGTCRACLFDGAEITFEPKPDKVRWLSGQDVCKWEGVICAGSSEVQGVELFGQNLTGTLPSELAALPFLQQISLAYNELSGTIPAVYATLNHLLAFEVHGNRLTGTIPEAFFEQDSTSLVLLNVGDNMLSGTIDTRIGLMTDLKGLHLFENKFVGTFPTELVDLNFLSFSRFNGNSFEGTLPTELLTPGR